MALVLKDRVKETTTTTGTGTVTLAGAVTGFQSFSVIGNANTTYYVIAGQNTNEWEVGIGTYTASGTTLSRDTVLESSNSGSLVNFSAGVKDVFVTYPAENAVFASDNPGTSGQYLRSNGAGVAPTWETLTTGDVVGPASSTDNAIARFDGTTGKLIQNSAVTIDDTTGSMTFTGVATGTRFRADMSASADADRFAFQSSITNGTTNLQVIPNGTATSSNVKVTNSSDLSSNSNLQMYAGPTFVGLFAGKDGTGSFLPLTFYTNGSERLRITTNGGVSFGSSGTAFGTSGQVLQSNGDAPPTWVTPSSGSGTSIGLARAIAINCILP